MSDNEFEVDDFEVVDDIDEKPEEAVIGTIWYIFQIKKASNCVKSIFKVPLVDNTAAKNKIAELGKTERSVELFNDLERGVDDFSNQMVELINKNRQKIKELWLKPQGHAFFALVALPGEFLLLFNTFSTHISIWATTVQETIIERKRQAEKVFETVDSIIAELRGHIDQNTDGQYSSWIVSQLLHF